MLCLALGNLVKVIIIESVLQARNPFHVKNVASHLLFYRRCEDIYWFIVERNHSLVRYAIVGLQD